MSPDPIESNSSPHQTPAGVLANWIEQQQRILIEFVIFKLGN